MLNPFAMVRSDRAAGAGLALCRDLSPRYAAQKVDSAHYPVSQLPKGPETAAAMPADSRGAPPETLSPA